MSIKVERSEEGVHSSSVDLLSAEVTTIRELIERMAETAEAPFLISPETGKVLTFLELPGASEGSFRPTSAIGTGARRQGCVPDG